MQAAVVGHADRVQAVLCGQGLGQLGAVHAHRMDAPAGIAF